MAKDNLWDFYGNEGGIYANYFENKLTREIIDYYFDIFYYCYKEWCKEFKYDMMFDTEERESCADYMAVKMELIEPEETYNEQFIEEMLAVEKRIEKKIEKKLRIKKNKKITT